MLTSLLFAAVVVSGVAQQQGEPAVPPQATFRSGVDRVAVDVIVVDDDGRPVADLTADDFRLEVDGEPRAIASAEFISLRRLEDAFVPVHYSTNTAGPAGRLIALVIDQNNIKAGTGKTVFEAASRFMATLNRNDRVALYLLPGSGAAVDFTAHHALIAQRLREVVGRAAAPAMMNSRVGISEAKAIARNDQSALREVLDRECAGNLDQAERAHCQRMVVNDALMLNGEGRGRTAESLVSLRDLMQRMRYGRGRKTIVLLSEGLVLDQGIQDLGWVAPVASQGQITVFAMRMESNAFSAGSPRRSPSASEDRLLERDGLALLAGLAGGAVIPMPPSNPAAGFSRIGTELSGYYLVSFEPLPPERDGRTHDIRIETSRKGLTLRARRKCSMAVASAEDAVTARISETLASPADLTDVPLRITPYVLGDADGQLKVILAANIDRALSPSADMTLGYVASDSNGRIVGSHVEPSLGGVESAVQQFTSALSVPPGLYSMRVAVIDAAGREGSVGHTFEARLNGAGQVHWTDLLLSETTSSGKLMLVVDGPSGTAIQAYLELYSDVQGLLERATVVVDVARSDDGLPLLSTPLVFNASQIPGRRTGEAGLDVALLGEGEFVARASIRIDGAEVGRVIRPFVIGGAQR